MSDLEYMRSKMVRSAWDEDGSNGEGAVVAEVDPDEGEEGGEGQERWEGEGLEEGLEEGEGWEGKEGWEGEEREKDRDHGKSGERVVVAGTSASVHGKARGAADDDVEEETLAEHGRLFLRNLAYDVTDEDIQVNGARIGVVQQGGVTGW